MGERKGKGGREVRSVMMTSNPYLTRVYPDHKPPGYEHGGVHCEALQQHSEDGRDVVQQQCVLPAGEIQSHDQHIVVHSWSHDQHIMMQS